MLEKGFEETCAWGWVRRGGRGELGMHRAPSPRGTSSVMWYIPAQPNQCADYCTIS